MKRILATLGVLGVAGAVAGAGTFSAFSSTTANTGNTFAAGTVVIADNDAGSAMYSLSNAKPGDSATSCIDVTYTGSLDSDVRLYTASTIGALGPYVNLTITPGTQSTPSFPSCTGFTPDSGGAIWTGTLAAFAAAHSSYANGVVDYPGTVATKWVANDHVVYRFAVSLADDNNANGGASALTTGSHAFTWEARNQ